MIPVEESFAERHKDPEYAKAYDAVEEEFSLTATGDPPSSVKKS
jgi:hypothetical protein